MSTAERFYWILTRKSWFVQGYHKFFFHIFSISRHFVTNIKPCIVRTSFTCPGHAWKKGAVHDFNLRI